MKKFIPLFVLVGAFLVAFGVYIIINRLGMATVSAQPAGFFLGLWFDNNITIYQAGNDGFWYNLGYILGLSIALGGGARASRVKGNRKKK
jgi:hypothetical protein